MAIDELYDSILVSMNLELLITKILIKKIKGKNLIIDFNKVK